MKYRQNPLLRSASLAATVITLGTTGILFLDSAQAQTTIPTGDTTYTGPLSLGAITRAAGNTATFAGTNTGTISGTAGSGAAVLNSILPWGTVSNTGPSAAGTSAGFTFGTYSGGNVVAYTAATSSAGINWGTNTATRETPTVNYDVTGVGGNMGVARSANSIRYVGTLGDHTTTFNNASVGALTINALMNASTYNFTIANSATGSVIIGTSNELVVSAAAGNISISAPITGALGSLTKTGAQTLTLSGTNTYGSTTGKTNVNAGTLLATKAAALPGYASGSKVSVRSGATLAVRAESGAWTSGEIDSLLGTAAFDSGSNLGIDVTGSNTFSYATNIGTTQAAKGLVKSGTGTLTLSTGTTHTYTGATNVTAGKLIVNGNISTSSLTTVSGTGTLGGGGTVGAVSVLTGGTFAPGNSIDNLDIAGALTLGTGSFSVFEINTAGDISDLAIVSGLLTFGGTLNVNNVGATLVNGDTFDLFNWGSKSGTFSAVNLPGLDTGLTWDQSQLYTTGTLTVVPEPRAALLGGLGLLALLRRRR